MDYRNLFISLWISQLLFTLFREGFIVEEYEDIDEDEDLSNDDFLDDYEDDDFSDDEDVEEEF